MQLNVPPIVPYVVGATLVLFGSLRIKYLGAPRSARPVEDDNGSTDEKPARGKEQRRHIAMGGVWVALGLFLLVSTYFQVRRGR